MYLRDLAVNTFRKSKYAFGHNGIVPGIVELYLSCLGKFYSGDFAKVIVHVDQFSGDSSLDEMMDVIRIFKTFDFEKYENESLFEKRKMVLDILHSGITSIAAIHGWDKEQLNSAYECCLSKNLEFRTLFKNKFWRAPNRKLYAGVYSCWEVDQYEAYIILLDKEKKEIYRTKLMGSTYLDLEPFGKVEWSDDSAQLSVFSKDGSKKWTCTFN